MDLHEPNASRDVALGELLLMERHHLTNDKFRCLADCEPAHLKTAIAALRESARLGAAEDEPLAEELEGLNLKTPREMLRKSIRKVRKHVQSRIIVSDALKNMFSAEEKGHEGHEHSHGNLYIPSKPIISKRGIQMQAKELGIIVGSQFVARGIQEAEVYIPGKTMNVDNSTLINIVGGLGLSLAALWDKTPSDAKFPLAIIGSKLLVDESVHMAKKTLAPSAAPIRVTGVTSSIGNGVPGNDLIRVD